MEVPQNSSSIYESTVDMTEDNFELLLPFVLDTIDKSDFISFDLEFSGTDYKPYFRAVYADTFETRYAKYRVDVENFYPIELGICCYSWNKEKQWQPSDILFTYSFISRPINFFICPYSHKQCNPNLSIRASTLGFLRQHQFKFGRLFSEGILTLRKSDEERILEYQRMSCDRYDYKNDDEKHFLEKVYGIIDEWVHKVNEIKIVNVPIIDSILLPLMDSHKRKMLYQEIQSRYPMISLIENLDENKFLIKSKNRYTRATITRVPGETIIPIIPDISGHAGVRRVVEAIIASHKPLIGFQAMGDLAYMIGGTYCELPPHLTDFLQLMEKLRLVVDLKMVVELPELLDEGLSKCSLSAAYDMTKDWYFGEPSVESGLINNESISVHDAASDAYMTGILFVKLLYRCGFKQKDIVLLPTMYESVLKGDRSDMTSIQKEFLLSMNTVNMYHMTHCMPLRMNRYNNMVNLYHGDLCRDNVIIIENVAPWLNTKHFNTFFSQRFGVVSSIYFNWLCDNMLLVTLPSATIAGQVLKEWFEEVTSEDSDKIYKTPTDFCNRHVVMNELKISKFSRYEELCFVNKHHVRNC